MTHRMADARATAEALRAEKDELARVLATAPGAFLALFRADDGRLTCPYGTSAVEEVLGISAEALAHSAQPLFERIHPDDLLQLDTRLRVSATTLDGVRIEYRYQHPAHGERWILMEAIPTREPDGSVLWLGFVRDETERRQAQACLQRKRELEAVATLTRGIAHDFNNLLSAIAGNCVLARDTLREHPAGRHVEQMEQQIELAMARVRQLQGLGSPSD